MAGGTSGGRKPRCQSSPQKPPPREDYVTGTLLGDGPPSASSKIHIKGLSVAILPFADDYSPPRSRSTAASIWVPQPQQLDSTWPHTIDSFSRDAEKAVFRPHRGLRGFNPLSAAKTSSAQSDSSVLSVKGTLRPSATAGKGKAPSWTTMHVDFLLFWAQLTCLVV